MLYQEIIDKIKPRMEKTLEHLKEELLQIRTGRASPALVEDIEVSCYETKLPLKQLATITVPEPRLIVVQPWDKNILEDLGRAIASSGMGLNPVIEGDQIRIALPLLTEERRREFLKIIRAKKEECRVSVRKIREEAWNEIQDLSREGKIREDDKFRGKDELQKLIDEYNEKVQEIVDRKEKEVMTV